MARRYEIPSQMTGTSVRRGRSVLGLMRAAITPGAVRERDPTLCHQCNSNPREHGFSRCDSCRAKLRKQARELRAYRRSHRLCATCGAPAAADRSLCKRHLAYYRDRDAGRGQVARADRRMSRKADGWCPEDGCDQRPEPGRTYCPTHLAWYLEMHRVQKTSGK